MKHILITICLFIFSHTYAETELSQKSLGGHSGIEKLQGLQFGGGYYQLNNEYSSGNNENLTGFQFILAYDYRLESEWSTKTSLTFARAANEADDASFETDTDYQHYVFAQSLSYMVTWLNRKWTPYIELGLGFGFFDQRTDAFSSSDVSRLGISQLDTQAGYSISTLALGLQTELKYGITPFVRYEITNIAFNGEDSTFTRQGSREVIDVETKLDPVQSSAFTFGMLYSF